MLEDTDIFLTIFSGLVTYWYIIPLVILYFAFKWYKNKKTPEERISRTTYTLSKEKQKEKDDKYIAHITNLYKKDGYTISEQGAHNAVYNLGIDIIAIKDKEILFLQCRDLDIRSGYKITQKDIQYIRMNVRDYIEKNPMFNDYKWKIIYITSEDVFDKNANHKIIEHNEEIDHKIIPTNKRL